REAEKVSLSEAWAASWWIVVVGLVTLGAAWQLAPDYMLYIMLIAGPQVLAPFIISFTSYGSRYARSGLFQTAEEASPTPVMLSQQAILSRWRMEPEPSLEAPVEAPVEAMSPVPHYVPSRS